MRTLCIISEGRTEVYFVKNVLAEHLLDFGWNPVISITLPTGKGKNGVCKGGFRRSDGYHYLVKQIEKVIVSNRNAVYTTFFDYYGFPADIPCYKEAELKNSPYKKVKLYETQIKKDVNSLGCQFIPYVQPYEFEALLFVDTDSSADVLLNGNDESAVKLKKELKKIKSKFETPEHINHSFNTAPSKRIESLVPEFVKNKAGRAGFSWKAVQKAGVAKIRQECSHFNDWLTMLETYE